MHVSPSTTAQLLPTFDRFLKDLDEVKVGVIQHLCAFLAVLDEGTRLECVAPPRLALALALALALTCTEHDRYS